MTDLLLTDCTVWDASGAGARPDAGVLIRDGAVAAVGPVEDVRSRAREGDGPEPRPCELGGATVLPGLGNLHTHFSLRHPGAAGALLATESDAELAFRMAGNAAAALRAGVTTVRCVGESRGADFALQAAIAAGTVPGPRVFTAGQGLCCTGGHGHGGDGTLECDGEAGFRHGVRAQLRAGADLIKVMISGGIAGEHEGIDTPQLATDELAAVLEVAHAWGRRVTAHAGPAGAIAEAVELGLDGVEHGYELTPEVAQAMADRGVQLVPTLVVTRCREYFERMGVPAWMMERALGAGERHMASFAAALEAGVPIGLGSDMLPAEPYEDTTATVRELEFMVEGGMTPEAALEAATLEPVRWLGAADQLGTLEVGKRADLIAVEGDPLADIAALRRLHLVLRDGRVARDDRALLPRER
ncbi:amidohydrolase family protein [Egibacter rhizosphaerae]|uniref:Amidohydrolase family protein n=1 Tax=Egibacter rhizosphaerae TaxID=1670831 RepID=A0A411YF95_9ACTN|nr:amidohydrolase family protein [Egibacter rhizosphaerae]QBI19856.1 amidohydrolase family protein [Egibacter rhizosphaerae]